MSVLEGDAAARMHLSRVERYYDFIYHWTQVTNRFCAFEKAAAYAIHRGLADPVTGEFSTSTVHRLIAEQIPVMPGLRGLDAGCGYGGSLIEMHNLLGGSWHGITISRRQLRIAQRTIGRLGLAASLEVSLQSFDRSLETARYDAVIAIESLIHSSAPAATIDNLAKTLDGGGLLIIVDDMPVPNLPASLQADLDGFKRDWRCPVMPRMDAWCDYLEAAGCEIAKVEDLTDLMRPRTESETQAALRDIARRRIWRDAFGLKLVSDAQEGGLRLERLAREGGVKYRMIIARKK